MIRFRGKTKPLRKRLIRRGFCILNTVDVHGKTIVPFAGGFLQSSCSGPAYVFAFFSVLYAKRTCDPARRELFYRVPACGGICFPLFRHFICRKDSFPGAAGTFFPSSRSRRHMFFSFSPFHMPERLLPRPGRSFFSELLLRAGICFSLFRHFICRSTFVPCRGIVFGRRFGLLWRVFLEKRLIFRHFAVDFISLTW